MQPTSIPEERIHEALRDIIRGRVVKRTRHDLHWGTRDLTEQFITVLIELGYVETTVDQVDVKPGERVPAFHIKEATAYFGWVFWEKFTDTRMRKLFGSVIRNDKGDWALQISEKRASAIFANPSLKTEMDIDNPSAF